MSNNQDLMDAAIERSQAFLGAVLGVDEEGNLPPDHRIGANHPPEPIVEPEDKRVADLVGNATQWCTDHPAIETEEVAKAAADWIKQLNDTLDAYEEKFKKEKEPHETELKTIRGKWKPRLERLEICLRVINPLHRAYIKKKDARLKAERAAAELEAAEAQRRADQLAEQAKAGGPGTVTNMIAAAEATQEAERARQAVAVIPQRAQVRGNLGGRTHSLRTVWNAKVVQPDLLYEKMKNHPDVLALLDRLANAAVRAKDGPRPDGGAKAGLCAALPGCYVYESQE